MTRNNTLYNFAEKAKFVVNAFETLTKLKKIIHLDYSFESFLIFSFIINYDFLNDETIITEYFLIEFLVSTELTTFSVEYVVTISSFFDTFSNYVMCQKNNI